MSENSSRCVVFFSGGAASWAAGKLAAEKYGRENTTLLFTDTMIEDADLYRFLDEGARNIGAPLVRICDGRTPWQVFHDVGILGNSRIDPCSRVLKREIAQKWITDNFEPSETSLVFGIDWTEAHRFERFDDASGKWLGVKHRYAKLGWPHVEAICTLAPTMAKWDIWAWMKREGLKRSRSYDDGFAHDNCGGACVKAGKAAWAHLLRRRPDVYARWESEEEAFNAARPDKRAQTILRDEFSGAPTQLVSLREFRLRLQSSPQSDLFDDWGGCGCFIEEDAA